MTNRKKQAIQTEKKIFNAAVSLMQKHGFEETSIEQICKKANVSVGSFYNYFKSKQDVLTVVYGSADQYFKDEVAPHLDALDIKDKILLFYTHYAKYNTLCGLDFVRHLYGSTENKFFVAQDRFMHHLLHMVLTDGLQENRLTDSMTIAEIEQFLFILARGIVNDWCLYDGTYDLEEKMRLYFDKILPIILK